MPMKPTDMVRLLKKNGFKVDKGKGNGGHLRLSNSEGLTTEVPMHSKELRKGTQLAILKEAGLR